MKKLLTIVAGLALAGMTQAASIDWSATALYTFDGTTAVSATGSSMMAYLFVNTDSAALASTIDGISTALKGGDRTALTGYVQARSNKNTNKIAADASNLVNGLSVATYYAQMIIVNAGNIDDATWFYTSNVKSELLDADLSTPITFGSQKTAGMNSAANWAEIAPEPTSGLMMLLGMGVLALRRRRA